MKSVTMRCAAWKYAWACAAALALAGSVQAAPGLMFGPYKDLLMGFVPGQQLMVGADGVAMLPALTAATPPGGPAPVVSWAFATGECGAESWHDQPAQEVADVNVAAFVAAGVDYIISTGGEGGLFTCGSDAGMAAFVQRYNSARLAGFDFDIEASQSPAQIEALVRRLAVVRRQHPQWRLSFTVATFAATDGSRNSLNATGERVLAALRKAGVEGYVLNLMVMDFGAATPASCVVVDGRCDMAASARQAAENVSAKYGVPLQQIALTAMLGMNDVVANVFTTEDAARTARYVREHGLAGLHYWSWDRDGPCAVPTAVASSTCHSLAQPAKLGYYRAFSEALAR